jgi:surface protein
MWSFSETDDADKVTDLPPVPEIHKSRENTQGEYLAEANLVLEPDLVFGEPLEEPQAYWSQPKVRRRALFVFLVVVGMVVGVGVGGSFSAPPIFDCSNKSVGCLYTGSQSLGFQDADTFLVANCMNTNFKIPTSENCDCEVNIPTSSTEGFESCQSCSFVASTGDKWRLAYDCSNILSGSCVGRDTNNTCISRVPFGTTSELRRAVDDYLANNSTTSLVARTYGWPIGIWDVSKIQDFRFLFSADESIFSEQANPTAATFNEDISGWTMSSATNMTSMFAGARSFDQPIGNWNVSSVQDMSFMFSRALSFDQPLGDWNVSGVTDMSNTFHSASSFNQPLVNWEVSSVRDMSFMFAYATSFNRSFAEWNVSIPEADITFEVQVQVHYDDFPEETGWTLRDSSGTLISSQSTGSFTTQNSTVTKNSSVAFGTYTFEMTDTFGDGICCGGGSGSFSIAVNGETVVSNNGRFDSIVQETFEVSNEADIRGIFTGADATFEVQVQVRHDGSSKGTGWTLWDSFGTLISCQAPGSFPTAVGTVTKNSSVALGTYTFEMTDTVGNATGFGSFSIAVNGETVVSNSLRFENIVQETFEVQAPTPSRSLVFETREELREAVDLYLADSSTNTLVARNYGWPIGIWDVSKIQDFSYLFSAIGYANSDRFNPAAANFNEDVSGWELSSATTMTSMFDGAGSFDQPIGSWNVSSVRDMSFMFSRALSFDQPLGDWNVSRVTDMRYTFYSASSFNQPLVNWEVSSVRDMSFMFAYATSFNRSFAEWNGTDIRGIFAEADATFEVQVQVYYDDFPEDTGWTLRDSTGTPISSQAPGSITTQNSTVTKNSSVAFGTYTFEMTDTFGDGICCNFGSGSFSIVVNGETVVSNNGRFDSIVQETFEVQPTPSRFLSFERKEELREAVDLYLADSSTNTLVASTYGWPIGEWDVSQIRDFSFLFAAKNVDIRASFNPAAATFNEDISDWDMSSATNTTFMFYEATSFNQPLAAWDVSSVATMSQMFRSATSFNQPIGNWSVSSVTTMRSMFSQARSFDQSIGNWSVSSVTDMRYMFASAASFNRPIGNWNVSSVTSMSNMFLNATSFNQSLGNWSVSEMADRTDIFKESGCPGAEGEKSCFLII